MIHTALQRREKVGRRINATVERHPGNRQPHQSGYSPSTPHVEALGSKAKGSDQTLRAYCIDQRAMLVLLMCLSHERDRTHPVDTVQGSSLMELQEESPSIPDPMIDIRGRVRERIAALNISQAEFARRCGLSPQRMNNYLSRGNLPDLNTLVLMAKALSVTTDWLLGLNESGAVEISPIVLRLLELEGIAPERASVIAEVVQEALRILSALPAEGDPALRSRMAAQAAWNAKPVPKPKQ